MAKKNLERRMIPFRIDLNIIPIEELESKSSIPIEEPVVGYFKRKQKNSTSARIPI